MVKLKTIKRGINEQLSRNFKSGEIDCKGKNCCTETVYAPELIERLQWMRDKCGKPIVLNSVYRCKKHNGDVGGTSGSRHLKGMAADIAVPGGMTLDELAALAESAGMRGVLKYTKSGFVHADVRETKPYCAVTDDGKNFKAVDTHGGELLKNPGTVPDKTIRRGSDDITAVIWIQSALKKAGFECIAVDGIFGEKTENAVKCFQFMKCLGVDGLVGTGETVPALKKVFA